MKLYGLQKMTLLDFPGHVACTVFLGGCDFRCPFCHNFELAAGKAAPVMEEDEFFSFLAKRKGLLDGVAVTGGEPCLHKGLPAFLERVRGMGFGTKLDTNGHHPELLREILDRGLADYVAMDIKNSPEKYDETCGTERTGKETADIIYPVHMDRVRESIALIIGNAPDYEFRTTVVDELHEASDFEEIGKMIAGAKQYFLQSFTDRDTVPFEGFHAPDPELLEKYAEIVRKYAAHVEVRGVQ